MKAHSPRDSLETFHSPALAIACAICLLASTACGPASPTTPASPVIPTAAATATQPVLPTPTPTASAGLPSKWIDLAYASTSSAQKLDLYLPAGSGPFPTIVYVHGGGFRIGDKDEPATRGVVARVVNDGYAIASLNYRLSGEAKFPAAVQDVKTAVRWLRAHATEYNLDPGQFASWGTSAGANLASMLGTSCGVPELEGSELGNADQSSCVQAVVDLYGPIDFVQMDKEYSGTACPATHNKANSAESQYVGGPIQKHTDLVKQANPITYITADDPPFFIQHGTADCTVPPQQSQLLYDALKPVIGAKNVSLAYLDGAEHGDKLFTTSSNLSLVVDFLDQYLKK